MKNIIGPRVKEARETHNPPLTQVELTARLQIEGWEISRGTLSKIELGIRQVTDIEIVKLSKTLGYPPGWFFGL